jgi:cell division protein FtsL
MKLIIISVFLFCALFVLAIPMKMEDNKLAVLISQEKSLEDSISMMRYNLALVEVSIDSLSSRKRIDAVASQLGLGIYEAATKITRHIK